MFYSICDMLSMFNSIQCCICDCISLYSVQFQGCILIQKKSLWKRHIYIILQTPLWKCKLKISIGFHILGKIKVLSFRIFLECIWYILMCISLHEHLHILPPVVHKGNDVHRTGYYVVGALLAILMSISICHLQSA